MAVICWAPDCNHNNMSHQCSFFRFPKNIKVYRKWLTLLRRDDQPGSGARICSCHFRDGKKTNNPELFLRNESKLFGEHYLAPEKKKMRKVPPVDKIDPLYYDPQPSTSSTEITITSRSTTVASDSKENIILETEIIYLKSEFESED